MELLHYYLLLLLLLLLLHYIINELCKNVCGITTL